MGFIKFAFKLKAIYQCGLTLNWNITTVRIVSKIFYLVFPDIFNMLRLVYFMTKSICYLTKGLESWVPNIRIYYEIFQVLSTKDGVKKNYSTVGFGHWMRGTLVLLLGTSWCRRSFNFLWKLQGVYKTLQRLNLNFEALGCFFFRHPVDKQRSDKKKGWDQYPIYELTWSIINNNVSKKKQ